MTFIGCRPLAGTARLLPYGPAPFDSMPSIFGREEGTRWPRGQKFQLTALGQDAEARYQAVLQGARDAGGRVAFDEATKQFAAPLGIQPGDGAFLGELKAQPRTIVD